MNYFSHADTYTGGGHMWGEETGFGMFFWMVFWVIAVSAMAWFLFRWSQQGEESKRGKPEDIAKERYAKGEITKKEFEEIIKELAR